MIGDTRRGGSAKPHSGMVRSKTSPIPEITALAERAPASNRVEAATTVPPPRGDLFKGTPVLSRSAVTDNDGTVIERIRTADGKSHRVTKPPKPLFDNASDQLIAMAVSGAKSGVGMPPLPLSESVEADFKKSLDKPIEILESDSDEVKLMKLDVMAVRDELRELVAQGLTVREALAEHQSQVNRIAAYHQEALRMIQEIREKDGPEAANEFLKTINEKLRSEGSSALRQSVLLRRGSGAGRCRLRKRHTPHIASITAEINAVVPILCAVNIWIYVPRKVSALVDENTGEIGFVR